MIGEEEREVVFAVAAYTEDILILFLGKGRVFRVDILHDVDYFLGVQTSIMLEPYYPTMNSAEIAIRTNFRSKLF